MISTSFPPLPRLFSLHLSSITCYYTRVTKHHTAFLTSKSRSKHSRGDNVSMDTDTGGTAGTAPPQRKTGFGKRLRALYPTKEGRSSSTVATDQTLNSATTEDQQVKNPETKPEAEAKQELDYLNGWRLYLVIGALLLGNFLTSLDTVRIACPTKLLEMY